ncbi:hypothetical protein CcaCcLH18_12501 [Colletotrichum camelliae]|nr:hypothetical protein CcaCcLH18_12501 [Colletotrichum camelliae]
MDTTNATGDQADREYSMLSMRMLRTAHSSSGAEITKSERPKEFESLPLFGNLSAYDVDEVTEARLWELEAGRLFEALGGPRLFPESATATPEPDKSNTNTFDQVELLASPVLSALAIYGLDDQSSLKTQQSYGDLRTDSVSERAIKRLERRFGRVDQVVRLRDVRYAYGEFMPYETAISAEPTPEKAVNVISDTDARKYHALIDYLTATVVCYVASGFEDDGIHRPKSYWQAITLTIIAKIAVKIKILRSGNPSSGFPRPTPHLDTSNFRPPLPASPANAPSEAQDSYVKAYLFDMCEVSSTLFSVMWSVLSDLKTRTSQRLQKDDFDISTIVYSMGTRHVPAMIYQDRLAQVAGSHTGMALGMGRRALDILIASADQIQQKHQAGDLNLPSHFQHSHPHLSIEMKTVTKIKMDIRIHEIGPKTAQDAIVMFPAYLMENP